MNYELKKRLDELPFALRNQVREAVIRRASVSPKTFLNVLNGHSGNLHVFVAFSQVLGCTIEEIMDKDHSFDPEVVCLEEQPLTPKQ